MKITKTLIDPEIPDIEYYNVKVNTMEGDADDYHEIDITADSEKELRNIIIHTEIMMRCFPHGRGGYDDYKGKYFTRYFSDELYCNEGCQDSIEDYEITFHNTKGEQYSVTVEFDEEMIEEIKNPKMSKSILKDLEYPSPEDITF